MRENHSDQQLDWYRLVSRLGSGRYGSVYLGEDLHLKTTVAIKLIETSNTPPEQFYREVRTLIRLRHPHIIPLLDFGIDKGTPYIVMEFEEEGSLDKRHPWGTQVPLTIVVQYTKQIADALQHAHDTQMLHRDVKPENVLIGTNGNLLLGDFGIAVLSPTGLIDITQSVPTNRSGGTPYYMAPEQCQGKPEKKSDQYALAIMAYQWLCGTPPFTEGNPLNIMYQHVREPVPPLREKLPTLEPAVEAVIMRALAKKPEERFRSVTDFALALEEAAQMLPNEELYPEYVRQAIRERYYTPYINAWSGQPESMARALGEPEQITAEDARTHTSMRGTVGYMRPFRNGVMCWSERGGAQPVWYRFSDILRSKDSVEGYLGFPLTCEERAAPSPYGTTGVFQRFEGPWDYPEEINTPPVRCGASLYYSEKYRSHPTRGDIGIYYERSGRTSGKLGFPITEEMKVGPSQHPDKTQGYYQEFEGGYICWSEKTESHDVVGKIAQLYTELELVVGRLGFPLADEEEVTSSLGTTGIRQHFEGGERDGLPAGDQWEFSQGVWVYSSTHGTYPVWGGPHIYYDTNGQHQSALGFPVDKERQATPSPQKTEGWYQEFEGGNIHWTAKYGSVPVIGAIHDLYRSLGGSGGNFGFPTDPEESVEGQPNMRMQQFEGGALCIVTT